jgi:hypothetical protein
MSGLPEWLMIVAKTEKVCSVPQVSTASSPLCATLRPLLLTKSDVPSISPVNSLIENALA